jgi:hypothetical protein
MSIVLAKTRLCLLAAMTMGTCGSAFAVGLTYVDGSDNLALPANNPYTTTPQNLFAADGGPLENALDAFGSASSVFDDGKWGYRTNGFGARGTIYEASEDAPEIYQLLTGLTPNASYDVYVAYWSSTGNWGLRAGPTSNPGANPAFNARGGYGTAGYAALYAAFDVLPEDNYTTSDDDDEDPIEVPPVLTQTQNAVTMEGNRDLYLGPAALNFQANASGEIRIYLDDVEDLAPAERSFFDGLAYAPANTPIALRIEIDRTTGNAQLINATDQDFRVARFGLNSAAGTLNASEWITITGNTDGAGNQTRDTDPWEVTDPDPMLPTPSHATALREVELDDDMMGLDSDGALIPANTNINLGNIWHASPYEDISALFASVLVAPTLPSPFLSHAVAIQVDFVNGTPLDLGDFNQNGIVDAADYTILINNMHRDLTTLTDSQTHMFGDISGNGVIDFGDLVGFKTAYETANGAGSFAAHFGSQVPEPSTIAWATSMAIIGLFVRRRRTAMKAAPIVLAVFALIQVGTSANAQNAVYIDADPSNTVVEGAGPVSYSADAAGGGTVIGTNSGTDGFWRGRNFGQSSTSSWVAGSPVSIYESGGTEDTARLVTSFTLPSAGLYQIYGFYWDDTAGTGWDIDFQLGSRPVSSFRALSDGKSVEAASLTSLTGNTIPVLPGTGTGNDDDGNRNMYAAPLGIWSTSSDGLNVTVAADSSLLSSERSWYDGVGYAPVESPILVLEVNRTTGEATLSNTFGSAIALSYYEIRSNASSLNRAGWNSLDDQNLDAVDGLDGGTTAGDSVLEGWDENGSGSASGDFNADGIVNLADYTVWRDNLGGTYTAADYQVWKENFGNTGLAPNSVISENFLLGVTSIPANTTVSLGNIYSTSVDVQDLTFSYGLVSDGTLVPSAVLYSGGAGALASATVPEPSSFVLVALLLGASQLTRRRRRV